MTIKATRMARALGAVAPAHDLSIRSHRAGLFLSGGHREGVRSVPNTPASIALYR